MEPPATGMVPTGAANSMCWIFAVLVEACAQILFGSKSIDTLAACSSATENHQRDSELTFINGISTLHSMDLPLGGLGAFV